MLTGEFSLVESNPAPSLPDNNLIDPMTEQLLDTYYSTPYGDFAIMKTRFGLFTSYDRDCVKMVTGGTWEAVFQMTPHHMKWAVEGYTAPEGKEVVEYDGVVGGKL